MFPFRPNDICNKEISKCTKKIDNICLIINSFTDSSKKRHDIRRKIAQDKATLVKLIEKYNSLATLTPDMNIITPEAQEQGAWPWIAEDGE